MPPILNISNPIWTDGFPSDGLKPGMVLALADGSCEVVGHFNWWSKGSCAEGTTKFCEDCLSFNGVKSERWYQKKTLRWAQVLSFGGEGVE